MDRLGWQPRTHVKLRGTIRHGEVDFKNAPAEDAKYILVSCSAFVDYLIEKWSKVNVG